MSNNTEQHTRGDELYRRYLEGDNEAFEDLVGLFEDDLSRYIYNMVNDYYETKHLTIETFARLAVGGKKFAFRSTVKTYLFTIGRNLCCQHIKKRGKEAHVPYEEVLETLADDGDTPDMVLEREENKRRLHAAMCEMKEEHRVVIDLIYFQDMSYSEAARVMSKTVRQIEGLARRAKETLKHRLENDDLFCY